MEVATEGWSEKPSTASRLKAVMEALSMSRAQASRYMGAAKDKGMIPTTPTER